MLIERAAVAADYYNMPLFQYIDYFRDVARRYGEQTALDDLNYTLALRDEKIEKAREDAEEMKAKQ